jgi:hypothetical protein
VEHRDERQLTTGRRQVIGIAAAMTAAAIAPNVAARQATPSPGPDWSAVDTLLASVAPRTTLLVSELIDGVPVEIHAWNADEIFPIGSTFKFWILGALALRVQAGEIGWEDEIAIEDRHKSVPGGDLRYAPAGTRYTVRYIAERMMQKSDNTATDHLFALVGRGQVEAAMVAMGHSDPALNSPIINTRELVTLKYLLSTDELDAYQAMTTAERLEFLETTIEQAGLDWLDDMEDVTVPVEIDRVEWFATRHDLAATVAWIQAKSEELGLLPLLEVIALETQLTFDAELWPYVGFKGGSEPGVLSGTWLMHRADGRRFVFSIGFADPQQPIDMPAAVAAMDAARDAMALIF